MTPELQNSLYERYPKIFRQKDMSIQETCMCWGICTGDGWYDIINMLCNAIHTAPHFRPLTFQALSTQDTTL